MDNLDNIDLQNVDLDKLSKADMKKMLQRVAVKGLKVNKYTNCRSVTFQSNAVEMPSNNDAEVMNQLRELNAIKQYAQIVDEWKTAMVEVHDQYGNKKLVQRVRHNEEIDVLETEQELLQRLNTAVASRDKAHPKYNKDAKPGEGIGSSHKVFRLNESLDKYKPEDSKSGFKAQTCFGTNVQQMPHEEWEELIKRNPDSKKQRMRSL